MYFKISKICVLISVFACIISSCKKYREQENDSYESYRYELWKNLVDNNYDFDFVGRQKDYGTYEEYLDVEFDNDHEGAGGYESEDVLDDIDEILAAIPSLDVVLLSIGGNDLLDGGNPPSEPISNIVELVEKLQTHNSNVTIFLERIAPANSETMTSSLTNNLNEFNSQIVSITNTLTTNTSKVIALDMNTNFNESYLADDVHYNKAGAKFIADIYFDGIQSEHASSSTSINILPLGDSRVEGNRP
jgi:hypothetical protein